MQNEVLKLWCETCGGSGEVYQEHQAGCHVGGHFKCPDCDGNGYFVSTRYSLKHKWVDLKVEEMLELSKNNRDFPAAIVRLTAAKLKENNGY